MEKSENTTTKVLNKTKSEATTPCSSKDDSFKSIQSKAPSDIKSFFLNYTKKSETKSKEEETEILDVSLSYCDENSNDVPCLNEEQDNHEDNDPCSEVQEVTRKTIPEDSEAAGPCFEMDSSGEAPCPQCGAPVTIVDMSEHLDLHVAQELHAELNSVPAPTPRPQVSTQSVNKRKYTKSVAKNTSTKKTKGIESFFSHK